jgi:hypothetical protein
MAEAIVNSKGQPNFSAYSAGSHPLGTVRPEALGQLEMAHLPTEGLRRHGMNSLCLALQSSTLFLRFATTRRKRYAQSGPDSRLLPIRAFPTQRRFTEPKRKWNGRFARRFLFWNAESVDCSVFR